MINFSNFMKYLLLFIFIKNNFSFTSSTHIIYIHLGNKLPAYIFDSIEQTKLFNPESNIYIVCYQNNIENINQGLKNLNNIYCIASEELFVGKNHETFLKKTKFTGLWKFAIERFFYIEQVMLKYNLEHVFHLENDNLIYFSIEEYLDIFKNNFKGIAATFDNDHRCIPGFIYIKNIESISKLNDFILENLDAENFDMEALGKFRNKFPEYINNLPVIPEDYIYFHELKNTIHNESTKYPKRYSNNINFFKSVFDGAAIGQYLGGIDPFHENSKPGFINERAIYNASNFKYEWKLDNQQRKVPYLIFNNKSYRINNLHIHCKNLKKFIS